MYQFLLKFSILFTIITSNLFASKISLNQEDTLKYNVYKLRKLDQPFILHAALEGPNAVVGGLGSVMRDLGNKLKIDVDVVQLHAWQTALSALSSKKTWGCSRKIWRVVQNFNW